MSDQSEELQPPDISPGPLNFGTLLQGKCFTLQKLVTNRNGQPLLWCADAGGTHWLTMDRNVGILEEGEQHAIYVKADTSCLTTGAYAATLTVSWEGDDYSVSTQIPITMDVSTASPLAVGLTFSLAPNSSSTLPTAITNRTDQPVSWIADTGGASWLSLDRSSGVTQPHEVQTVYVTANTSALAIGDYAGTVTFTPVVAGATPASTQLLVELHVNFTPYSDSGPRIPLATPANRFELAGGTNNIASFQITNQEPTPVSWTVDNGGVNWLALEPSQGVFNAQGDSVTITATAAGGAPATKVTTDIRFTVTFTDPARAQHEPSSITIPITVGGA